MGGFYLCKNNEIRAEMNVSARKMFPAPASARKRPEPECRNDPNRHMLGAPVG
jgi:hypothetical protein